MPRYSRFEIVPGQVTNWSSQVPINLKIVTTGGAMIEIEIAISPHQNVKFTTPLTGMDLAEIEFLVEETQPPRRPRLVQG